MRQSLIHKKLFALNSNEILLLSVLFNLNSAPVLSQKIDEPESTIKFVEFVTDQYKNLTLPCGNKLKSQQQQQQTQQEKDQQPTEDPIYRNTMWIREGKKIINHKDVQVIYLRFAIINFSYFE